MTYIFSLYFNFTPKEYNIKVSRVCPTFFFSALSLDIAVLVPPRNTLVCSTEYPVWQNNNIIKKLGHTKWSVTEESQQHLKCLNGWWPNLQWEVQSSCPIQDRMQNLMGNSQPYLPLGNNNLPMPPVITYLTSMTELSKTLGLSSSQNLTSSWKTKKHPVRASAPGHRITYLPYSIHLGKNINVKSPSKVRSLQSEVYKCVSIL